MFHDNSETVRESLSNEGLSGWEITFLFRFVIGDHCVDYQAGEVKYQSAYNIITALRIFLRIFMGYLIVYDRSYIINNRKSSPFGRHYLIYFLIKFISKTKKIVKSKRFSSY